MMIEKSPFLGLPPDSLIDPENIRNMLGKAVASPAGCFVEIGVYRGGTAWWLDRLAWIQRRQCFLYDTFEGIPYCDPIDHHLVGDFGDADFGEVCKIMSSATSVIKGIFPACAVEMPPVAFVHLDCDQYRSIVNAVNYLRPLMVEGAIIWIDDSPVLDGAHQAAKDLFGDNLQLMNGRHFVTI